MYIDKHKSNDYPEDTGYRDEDGAYWDNAESFLCGHILGFCGCGDNEVAAKYIRSIMYLINEIFADKENYKERWKELDEYFGGNAGAQYFVYYWLDQKEFTEHGSSVPGWLTPKGKEVLADLMEIFPPVEGK